MVLPEKFISNSFVILVIVLNGVDVTEHPLQVCGDRWRVKGVFSQELSITYGLTPIAFHGITEE